MKKILTLFLFSCLFFVMKATESHTVNTTAGNLTTDANAYLNTVTDLTVTGIIDARDFVTMRDNMPLVTLDLSGATIAAHTGTDGTLTSFTSYPANEIPEEAFKSILSLTNISMPSSTTAIGNFAFQYCGLTGSLIIPSSVTSIGDAAFFYCDKLTDLTIPSSVTYIGPSAFSHSTNIKSIKAYGNDPSSITLGSAVFYLISTTTCTLHVPAGTKALYAAAAQWKNFITIIDDLAIAPAATSTAASSITSAGAILNGTVNANNASTAVTFEYGTSTSYGTSVTASQSPVTGKTATTVSYTLTGLTPNTTYRYRVIGVNSEGTTNGGDMSFTTLVPNPTVTGISPINGPTTGPTSVTITGTDLTAATAVMFGGTNATGFTVNSATQITATAPAGSAGTVDITVTTPNGTSTTNINDKFTYVAAPTVTTNAATSITSAGATLNGSINANNASTTVTFEYGLTTSYGTSVTAAQSPVTGGTATPVSKTITGLTAGTTYHYRVNGVNVGGTTNGTDLTFTTVATVPTESFYDQITLPFAPTDDVDMSSSTLAPSMYLASASTIKSYPSKGYKVTLPKSGTITLSASSNEIATNEFAFLVSTSYDASLSSKKYMAAGNGTTTTLTPGAYYIVLFTDNKYGKFRVNITLKALPNITSISPTSGSTLGGTTVTITGANFTGATAVKFGTTAATSYTVNSDTQITAAAPAGTGTVDVRVTTADGTSATSSADQFTYVATPTITAISPTSGSTAGSTSVVITGTNLTAATAVKFGSTNATNFTVNSATQITATAPARSPGVVDITVTTAGGTSATSTSDQFTYVTAPTVTTNAATSVTSTGATLNGSVNANNASTAVTFEYGLTTSYGTIVTADQSPVTGSAATPVSKAITGLTAGVTYYYRVVGVNAGGTTNGLGKSFTAPFFAGNGTPEDPYQIATLADLKWVSEHSDIWNSSFVQTANIDASITSTWNISKGFSPIGNATTKFTGSYNGQYHTITGLTINRSDEYNVGLFGVTANSILKNIALLDCSVIGQNNVGSLVGYMGYNSTLTSSISDCYCTGEVSGTDYVGGLAGANQSSGITNSYSTCNVTATSNAAGLVSFNMNSTIANCFYDKNTSGQSDTGKGTPKTTAEMKMQSTFTGWDFVGETANGTTNIWAISSTLNNGYPCFMSQITSPTAPTVTTQAVTGITETTATGNGNITGLGVPNAGSHGVCWGTSANPTIIDNTVANRGGVSVTGAFVAPITGLIPNTLYHVRAYATNSTGTVYGTDVSFTTQSTSQTISFGALDNKTYGDADYNPGATSATSGINPITYSSSNEAVATIVSGQIHIVGAGTTNITAKQAGNTTYNAAPDVTQQLIVNKRAINLTADLKTKTYGNTDPTLTAQVTSGTIVTGDVATGSLVRAAGETVADYAISKGTYTYGSNYNETYVGANLAIGKRAITITADAKTKTYGNTDPTLTAQVTSGTIVTGDHATGSLVRATGETVADYSISKGTYTYGSNYDETFVGANLYIGKRTITLTADAKTKTYGNTDPMLTAQVTSGTIVTGDHTTGSLARATGETVADYAISKGTYTYGSNYDETFIGANLTIGKRAINITADAKTKTYGNTDPMITAQVTSGTIVTGDHATGSLVRATGETVADYAISKGTYTYGSNYDETFVGANLTIGKRAINVSAIVDTKIYDGTNSSSVTPTYDALVNGDVVNTVPVQVFDNATVGTTRVLTASGLSIKNGSMLVTGNYDISYTPATGTINKLGVTVTALADTKTYNGTTVSTTIPTIGALAAGDVIHVAPTQAFDNATVGTMHVLTASGLNIKSGSSDATGNYDISYISANGNITAKPLTISAPNIMLNKVYDGNNVSAVTAGILSGVVTSDAGKVTVAAAASYNNVTVGTNKTITVVYTLGGSAAGNYSAPAEFVATGAQIYSSTITLEPLSNPTPDPANTGLVLSYNVVIGGPTQYKITFETPALAAGIQNVSYTALSTTGTDGSITITVPKGTRAGKYKGTLQMRNEFGVESTTYAFVLTVNIPSDYIAIKYNRVLVLDNSTKVFIAYQWYKDGIAIEDATKQFYRDPKGLVGTYTVQATTIDGEILYTDPKVLNIPLTQKVTAYPSLVGANQTCTVEIIDPAMELDLTGAELSVYSSQGIRVYYSTKVEKLNTIKLPTIDGMYSGRVTTSDGQSFLFKVIVAN